MKKLTAVILTVITLFMCGCGGTKNMNKIRAHSIIGKDYLEVKVKVTEAYRAGDTMYFAYEKGLDHLKEILDSAEIDSGTLSTSIINDRFLIIEKKNPDNRIFHYMIVNIAKPGQPERYMFSAPFSGLGSENFLIPLQYLPYDATIADGYFSIEENKEYELCGTKNDIIDFYKKVYIFDVTEDENTITVSVKDGVSFEGFHSRSILQITISVTDSISYLKFDSENPVAEN